jgi:hypothetical protein
VFNYIQSGTGAWIECPVGITAREKLTPPKLSFKRSHLIASQQPGVRVVHSEERQAFERSQRAKAMERVRTRLEKLARRVAKGRLKAAEKIGAPRARVLAQSRSSLLRLGSRGRRLPLLRASCSLHARSGPRRQAAAGAIAHDGAQRLKKIIILFAFAECPLHAW